MVTSRIEVPGVAVARVGVDDDTISRELDRFWGAVARI